MPESSYLKSKIRVGSIHSKLNYDRQEAVFHPDDIPKNIKKIVQSVHRMKQKNQPQTNWSKSTYTLKAEKSCTIPHKYTLNPTQPQTLLSKTTQFIENRFDLNKAKTFCKSSSMNDLCFNRTEVEWGTTDLRDLYFYHKLCSAEKLKKWNLSNKFDDDTRKSLSDITNKMRSNKSVNLEKYLNPTERQDKRMHQIRKCKDEQRRNFIKMLKKEKIERRLNASYKRSILKLQPLTKGEKKRKNEEIKSKLNKEYNRELLTNYIDSLKNDASKCKSDSAIKQRLIDLMMNKRNRMYTSRQLLKMQERRKYDILREYFHNGTYQNEFEGGWSCCMNATKNSQGCQVKLINTAAWQTVGI